MNKVEESVNPMMCPLSMYSGHPLPCMGNHCILWTEVNRDVETDVGVVIQSGFDCAYKMSLLVEYSKWTWEQQKNVGVDGS